MHLFMFTCPGVKSKKKDLKGLGLLYYSTIQKVNDTGGCLGMT